MEYLNLIKKENDIATILLYGIIGDNWASDVSTKEIVEDLEIYLPDVKEIILRINSPGGYIGAGVALYSALKQHKAKKIVMIDGMCGSIATVVAMAGDHIKMNKLGSFMIHNPLVANMTGNADKLRKEAENLDKFKNSIIKAYTDKTGLAEKEISDLMDNETLLTADEALEKKFIDEIEEFKVNSLVNCIDYNLLNEKKEEGKMADQKPQNTIKKEDITVDFLRQNCLEIYNQIKKEGVEEERDRLKQLDEMNSFKGAEEIVRQAKYENIKTASEISIEILKAQNKQDTDKKGTTFEVIKKDADKLNEIPGANPAEKTVNYIDQIVQFANEGK